VTDAKKKRGGLLAGNLRAAIAGAAALLFEGTAHAGGIVQPIINRARQRYAAEASNAPSSNTPEQLLMQPAGEDPSGLYGRGHRSHSSHRSHESHSSHYSGHSSHASHASHYSSTSPPPTPAPPPSPEPTRAPSRKPAVPAPFVPVPGQEYRITMKDGAVYVGTLTDRGDQWEIATTDSTPRRVFVAKADVVGMKALPK
jgi:hypothetical protein